MDKKEILELREYIHNKLIQFYELYKNENMLETSFSNWNARDVIGHINCWLKFSVDKLESIKIKKSFDDVNYISQVDIENINKTFYEEYKNETFENVLNDSKIILEKYKNIIILFNEEELMSNKFPTGFPFALWKYMAMDLALHPILHLLFHYIKNRDYNEFITEVEDSRKYFMECSENYIQEYNFNNNFENRDEKMNRFKELNEINKNNEIIKEIIKINMV